MPKTKFFRVAVEGETVDKRTISRQMIQDMADSYAPDTYTARINCEHLRGFSPEGPFNAWGSVDAVKAEQIDLTVGGKTEKRLALFASFDVTDAAQTYNQAGQKLFSSVEIQPDFAGTKKAYLVGIAFTDSPASLGTEVLKFSRDDKRKDNFVQLGEIEIDYVDEPSAGGMTEALSSIATFFKSLAKAPEPVAVVVPKQEPAAADAAAFSVFSQGFGDQIEKLTKAIDGRFSAFDTRLAKMSADHKALTDIIEKTPGGNYRARPATSGGSGEHQTDF